MGRLAGIDFGKVRIGLAITDEKRIIAHSLETLIAAKNPVQTAQQIGAALKRYAPIDALVIGLPLMLNGKEGEMALIVKNFAKTLEETLSLPVILWDERLTSKGVEKMLIEANVKRKKRAALSDGLAAVSILENYLTALSFSQ